MDWLQLWAFLKVIGMAIPVIFIVGFFGVIAVSTWQQERHRKRRKPETRNE